MVFRLSLSQFVLWVGFSSLLIAPFGLLNPQSEEPPHVDKQVRKADTTVDPPIPAKSCTQYDWFIEAEGEEKPMIQYVHHRHIGSLHGLACQWAVMTQELSVDSTQLPNYVHPTSDSLRLGEKLLAYGVKMKHVDPDRLDQNTLFLVAEVADSLFFHDIGKARPYQKDTPSTVSIRALRPIDVPGAESQYFWVEIEEHHRDEEASPVEVKTRWRGHIFVYHQRRGMRYLHRAPVRVERSRGGKIIGAEQWDVSVTEPGIMEIEPRLEKGKVGRPTIGKGGVMLGPREWLGRHVIDPTATSKREVEAEAGYTTIIDTTEVENWREKYEQ